MSIGLVQTMEAIERDPDPGAFTFRASSSWKDGTHNVGRIEGFNHAGHEDDTRTETFVLEGDEPPVLLGENHGPNAVELLLQALAFCYAVGHVANVAAQGIEITRMDYEIEGDFDVRPFLGLDGPRPGFTGTVEFAEELRRLKSSSKPHLPAEVATLLESFLVDLEGLRHWSVCPALRRRQ